jgi:hypothetical protein
MATEPSLPDRGATLIAIGATRHSTTQWFKSTTTRLKSTTTWVKSTTTRFKSTTTWFHCTTTRFHCTIPRIPAANSSIVHGSGPVDTTPGSPARPIAAVSRRRSTQLVGIRILREKPRQPRHRQIASGSYFYAMRSCEYLKVSGSRKTKLLLVEDIQFHIANRETNHSSPEIFDNDTVTITFKDQKNGERMQKRTAWRTNDPILSPVNAWTSIVTRIMPYSGCNKKTSVNTVLVHGRLIKITSTMIVPSTRSVNSRPRSSRLRPRILWNPLHPVRSSDGDAPRGVRNLRHHDHRPLEIGGLHGIHP